MRRIAHLVSLAGLTALTAVGACKATQDDSLFGNGGGGSDDSGVTSTTTVGQGGSAGGDIGIGGGFGTGGSPPQNTCDTSPDQDKDGDGVTQAQGDCNDCDPNVNPNAIEVVATADADGGVPPAVDEDCDGTIDNVPAPCDGAIAIDTMDPFEAAAAVELCKKSSGPNDWGVVEAKWVLPDGSPPPNNAAGFHVGHGALGAFGPKVNVQAGVKMLALSSGAARQPSDPGYQNVSGYDKGYTSGNPQGFPKESPACPGVTTGTPHDGTGLELTIRTPSNAQGFSFDFDFFTYEWPGFICSQYNDFFVALLTPIPMGQSDGNISFDSQGNPVSVNNALLDVCGCANNPPNPCQAGGKSFPCSLGDQYLEGTGFGKDLAFGQDHGSTYWLATQAPVQPSSDITIRWAVYDSGDGVLDSTTLVDHWQWIATAGTEVGTGKVPIPK
jgi:hypothetical protein